MTELERLSKDQLEHFTDLPRKQIKDKLIKFDFLPDCYVKRNVHEIPVHPKGVLMLNIEDATILPEVERTYVRGRVHTIG